MLLKFYDNIKFTLIIISENNIIKYYLSNFMYDYKRFSYLFNGEDFFSFKRKCAISKMVI
ncbi:hypothetical protein PFTANZ_03501 [Plasmodium falciparum Tanzania (2000708)]|uniref:Uncharacterized protein n=1 Tax=Plasmodium falciparum Tanzania (2000708) TaxID=1036725 RepID=A0A024W5U9_PLAFA|nr:hypothetical protein PFTANZ_03501 [Plasmodium falciparum Tanzania (2000708)]